MGAAATLKNESGESESHGLSLLDIVKHALATIIETLEPGDRLAIVAYSTKARVVVPLNALSGSTKTLATNAVKALSSGGQTNLWDGLTTGFRTSPPRAARWRCSSATSAVAPAARRA